MGEPLRGTDSTWRIVEDDGHCLGHHLDDLCHGWAKIFSGHSGASTGGFARVGRFGIPDCLEHNLRSFWEM